MCDERAQRGGVMSRARRRDRRVYLASHPVLFALLALARRRPVLRLGRTVLVNSEPAYRHALTRLPLDRAAPASTGGVARRAGVDGLLFDQEGPQHRQTRRAIADGLGAVGVDRLRPVWMAVLEPAAAALAAGDEVDLVEVAVRIAGTTAAALLGVDADPVELAQAARTAAAAARDHSPSWRRRSRPDAPALATLLDPGAVGYGLTAMLTVAAVNTTVAALPRAVAWCADARLWTEVSPALVDELLRVIAPSPLLPRVAAADGVVSGCPVRHGDRLVLMARHAVAAHRRDPDPRCPVPPPVASLVFGAGAHACPGARLARAQLLDTLSVLAPLRPMVVRAQADRRAALPSWRRLVMAATAPPTEPGRVPA